MPASRRRRAARATWSALVLVTTLLGAAAFWTVLAADGVGAVDVLLVVVFAALFLWLACSFWVAVFGVAAAMRSRSRAARVVRREPPPPERGPLPRTALLLPVMNERPARIDAQVRTILDSIASQGQSAAFDAFVLSDTTDPDGWVAEERVWADLAATPRLRGRVFYRHRARREGRKAGNVTDWCRRWGGAYRYMVVLDADSLMDGETLVELVRRMEESPRVAILQTPPRLAGHETLFARLQQFATSAYGPIHLGGFALLTGANANYWGHNAIVRIEPFARHCGLGLLPGRPPLGGEILSHDFVEAALLRRAGHEVRLAEDLQGSYEEIPPTLLHFARRDERWCQGNLQHVKLLATTGFRPVSRVLFASGAMAYVASPLWLAFLVLGVTASVGGAPADAAGTTAALWSRGVAPALFGVTLAMLLFPKMWGVALLLRDGPRRRACGGAMRVLASSVTETAFSALLAPTLMVFHTRFVLATLAGRVVAWGPQERDDPTTRLRETLFVLGPQTLIGGAAFVAVAAVAPELAPWMAPIFAGLVLAIPLALALESRRLGRAARRLGLLLTPEESQTPPLLRRFRAERAAAERRAAARAQRDGVAEVILDPVLHAVHLGLLRATARVRAMAPARRARIHRVVRRHGPERLTRDDRLALLSDATALRALHRTLWASR